MQNMAVLPTLQRALDKKNLSDYKPYSLKKRTRLAVIRTWTDVLILFAYDRNDYDFIYYSQK